MMPPDSAERLDAIEAKQEQERVLAAWARWQTAITVAIAVHAHRNRT